MHLKSMQNINLYFHVFNRIELKKNHVFLYSSNKRMHVENIKWTDKINDMITDWFLDGWPPPSKKKIYIYNS